MKALIFSAVLFCCAGLSYAQMEGIDDPLLFERLPGFELYDYNVTGFGAYRFCDMNGNNMIIEGMITYYYYETDGMVDPLKIVRKFFSEIESRGGQCYGDDPHQKYMVYRDTGRIVWVDLYAEDFYYTLNIIEKGEKISDINSDDLIAMIEKEGQAILYFNFDRDSCVIKEECHPILEMIARALSLRPGWKIKIVGYTDNIGRSDLNLHLSESRAETLGKRLIDQGVDSERIRWQGKGEADPIADNETLEGRTLNNRLVLIREKH